MKKPHVPVLNARQLEAVDQYMINGFNKAEALRAAGYSETMATGRPQGVFSNPLVKAEIERRKARRAAKQELTEDWIIERYMTLADAPRVLAKFKRIDEDGSLRWDFTDATQEDLQVIQELTTDTYNEGRGPDARELKKFKITTADVKGALDSLARIQGMFKDKVEHTGSVSLIERLSAGRERMKAKLRESLPSEAKQAKK